MLNFFLIFGWLSIITSLGLAFYHLARKGNQATTTLKEFLTRSAVIIALMFSLIFIFLFSDDPEAITTLGTITLPSFIIITTGYCLYRTYQLWKKIYPRK
jgi:L-asparagine transporter-like permease